MMLRTSKILALACSGAAALAVGGSTAPVFAQSVPAGSGKQWATTFSTEFNTGQSDLTGWSYDLGNGTNGWGNNEYQSYTNSAANHFVSTDPPTGTGALTIRAIGVQSGPNVSYTSTRIRTTNLFSQTYGLFEFRARLPAGQGLWPALWMMPRDSVYGGWPTSGEIDIFEGKGQDTGWASSALHSGPAWNQDNVQARTFAESGLRPAGFTTTDWHTYSLKWEDGPGTGAGTITFYIDGVAYHSRTGGWTTPAGQPSSAPFDQPFYIIMNMAVGGNFVSGLHPGVGSYDMQVDYVRAYSSINSTAAQMWATDANGNWSSSSRWTSAVVPNFIGADAQFGPVISQPRTVTVDTPVTSSRLSFNNSATYTIAGSQTINLNTSSGGGSLDVVQGSHHITAPLLLSKSTTITVNPAASRLTTGSLFTAASGSIVITKSGAGAFAANNVKAAGLVINSGTVSILGNGTQAGASRVGTMTIAGGAVPTATFDLADNDLTLTASNKATVENWIRTSRNGGAWDGTGGISSSAARAQPNGATTLGLLSGTEYISIAGGGATFNGSFVMPLDTLVKYTWYGDADFSGAVDFDDYVRIDSGYNGSLVGWLNGDFDYSGAVDFDDYVLIDLAFNLQSGTLRRAQAFLGGEDRDRATMNTTSLAFVLEHFDLFGTAYARNFLAAVPEPATALVVGAAALVGRPRRRVRKIVG